MRGEISFKPGQQSRVVLKAGVASLMHWSSVDRLVGRGRGQRELPLVIGYHRVVEDFRESEKLSMPSMLVSVRTFAAHLEWIGRHYDFVSLDELAALHEGARPRRRPVAAVTFDDGYRDFHQHAFPVLQRMGIPSAVFVVTDLTGTTRLLAHDELYLVFSVLQAAAGPAGMNIVMETVTSMDLSFAAKERLLRLIAGTTGVFQLTRTILETTEPPTLAALVEALRKRVAIAGRQREPFRLLDWDALVTLVRQGVTVGSHTCSHALLDSVPAGVVQRELADSRLALEQRLGVPVRHLAYPDGRFNAQAIREVAAAGYRTAVTICSHRDATHPLLTISRKMLWENSSMDGFGRFSPAVLSCQINGIFDPADRCRLQHWPAARPQ